MSLLALRLVPNSNNLPPFAVSRPELYRRAKSKAKLCKSYSRRNLCIGTRTPCKSFKKISCSFGVAFPPLPALLICFRSNATSYASASSSKKAATLNATLFSLSWLCFIKSTKNLGRRHCDFFYRWIILDFHYRFVLYMGTFQKLDIHLWNLLRGFHNTVSFAEQSPR